MKQILLATAAVIGLAGAAMAQDAPMLSGNYSPSVQRSYSGHDMTPYDGAVVYDRGMVGPDIDYRPTASIPLVGPMFAPAPVGPQYGPYDGMGNYPGGNYGPTVNQDALHR